MLNAIVAFASDHAWTILDIAIGLFVGSGGLAAFLVVRADGGGYGMYGRGISDPTDRARSLPVHSSLATPPALSAVDDTMVDGGTASVLPHVEPSLITAANASTMDVSVYRDKPLRARGEQ